MKNYNTVADCITRFAVMKYGWVFDWRKKDVTKSYGAV